MPIRLSAVLKSTQECANFILLTLVALKLTAMKKLLSLLVLAAVTVKGTAATGERSDDYLVVLTPLVLIVLVGFVYWVKAKVKAMKNRPPEETMETEEQPPMEKF
jgi:hypothetical protein